MFTTTVWYLETLSELSVKFIRKLCLNQRPQKSLVSSKHQNVIVVGAFGKKIIILWSVFFTRYNNDNIFISSISIQEFLFELNLSK